MTNDIELYGEIRSGTAAQFRSALAAAKGRARIRINSPGGDVSEAVAIIHAIQGHNPGVDALIEGYALSSASAIAAACRHVVAAEGAVLMIHSAWSTATGPADAMRSTASGLDKADEFLRDVYAKRTKRPAEEIAELMRAETWFSAREALDIGLIDEVAQPEAMPIAASFDLSRFTIPERFRNMSTTVPPTPNASAILAAETARRSEIRALFTPHGDQHRELLDQMLDDTTATPDMASKRLLAALAQGAGPVAGASYIPRVESGRDRVTDFLAAACDALLMRGGIKVERPHPAARDLKGMGLATMAERCESMRGRAPMFATHTGSDFPYLLANVANKSLLAGYEAEPASHLAWVKQTDVPDFKQQSRVARSEAPALEEVPEGAEIPFGSFSERREVFSISTYGRRFAITRQAIKNDDLGALTDMPRAFGQAARRAEADAVYSILTTNAAMADSIALFHADHNNLSAASASVAIATLGAARAAMRKQVGPGGGLLNVVPKYLLVPASLEMVAEELLASSTRADHPADVPNPFLRGLQLVVDPRLDAHSASAWYLIADHAQCDTVELARLEGRGVVVDEEQNFSDGSLQFRAILDFGVKALDHRGMYRYHTS
jgi:ATP-dependent protease ClpP protease subunit